MIEEILKAIWFIFPAYIANASPPVISRLERLQKHNKPIDFGKLWRGKEIFGKGKTWNGLIFGVLAGTIFGALQGLTGIEPLITIKLAFMMSFGALVGDMIGSFVKRRLNMKRGKHLPLVDQLDFILGAFLFASFVIEINFTNLIILLIITPLIHILTNRIGYKLKLKREPW